MKKVAIIGSSVSDSASPDWHNQRLLNRFVRYVKIQKQESLKEKELVLVMKDLLAANITSPFKSVAYGAAEMLTSEAVRCRSVNLLYWKKNILIGDNTDTLGFFNELQNKSIPRNKTWLVLGSGGASRACSDALKNHGSKPIIVSRDKKKNTASRFKIISYEEVKDYSSIVYGIVNATPEELPYDNFSVLKNCVCAWDLNYKKRSDFLIKAEKSGLLTFDGWGMFVSQARHAYFRWGI